MLEIAKFIPSKMRLELAQEVIEERGIRPLARELDVNPKSVYKYKHGTSHPGDEVMSKILAVAKEEGSVSLEGFFERLSESFDRALQESFDMEGVLGPQEVGREAGATQEAAAQERDVGPEPTEREGEPSVDERPTEGGIPKGEVPERIGVTDTFNRLKVEKIVEVLDEEPGLTLGDVEERTGISGDAVEKYLEMMVSEGLARGSSEGGFQLSFEVGGE